MKISVLILTHNRPQLFQRCIKSVLNADLTGIDLEILVNNDTDDIEQILDSHIEYFYNKSNNLGDLYKFLFDNSRGEYVYFLEDDDYIEPYFFQELKKHKEDILYFNYLPAYFESSFIRFWNYGNRKSKTVQDFLVDYNDKHFQIGQFCFKKNSLSIPFPTDNELSNDFLIFKNLKGSFKAINKSLYIQTRDSKDAISSEFNKDKRWNILNSQE